MAEEPPASGSWESGASVAVIEKLTFTLCRPRQRRDAGKERKCCRINKNGVFGRDRRRRPGKPLGYAGLASLEGLGGQETLGLTTKVPDAVRYTTNADNWSARIWKASFFQDSA